MHKPEKPMDPIEEVEGILKRLVPAAMSERSTRANDSMIDGLAGGQASGLKKIAKRHYWWQAGMAASIAVGAGLVFLEPPNADSGVEGDYQFLNASRSITPTSHEKFVEREDGASLVAVDYEEVSGGVYLDKECGIEIQIGQRDEGQFLVNNLGSF